MIDFKAIGYNVHNANDVADMMAAIGISSIDQLFNVIPKEIRLSCSLNLPDPLNEWDLMRDVRGMADMNTTVLNCASYLGGGAYEHHVPAVINAIVSRGEFLTAYTPYQPEMSQGLLQILFEFQCLMGRLLGHEAVNCSVYDGATALAESCWMMCSAKGKSRIVVADTIWSEYIEVLDAYLVPRGITVDFVKHSVDSGLMDLQCIEDLLCSDDIAGVVLQSPNSMGIIEDVSRLADVCKLRNALLCVCVNPFLCGWINPPGHLGADIVVSEGQSLGIPLNAGGPYIGIIACTKPLERYLPGRLVGRVHDLNGKLGYALVKEDREQHVARDKATSHICSNQALNAIRVAIYLACMGENNFKKIARVNADNAHYLHGKLLKLSGIRGLREGEFFNEFSIELPISSELFCQRMHALGVFAGLVIPYSLVGHDRGLLIAVTETKNRADLENYVHHAARCLAEEVA